ncbi:spore coat protein U domain-containing protein [Jeongeupia naejangsanensis]|uniref:Spore coat protein U domain-containing protein n=1 Tax=Jeongeupia naejangsanensis TaxID=613195 RepID=A0ABS2BIS9_9NEIS|nr:spore coat protein U domain-containing protein [Jeongeupia naejangsanensis]MBM3115345.1 spore coat protein U domain-containing protein [Jeongeupia naejangsanensis]
MMNKSFNLVMGTTLLVMAMGSAYAADKNVQIKAKVVGTCDFVDANDVVIDFGTLTPGGGDQTKSASTSFWCSNGVDYTVSLDNGLTPDGGGKRQMLLSGGTATDVIGYTLTPDKTSGTATGQSTPISLTLDAGVKGTDYQDAKIGDYNDTVILTVDLAP